MLEEKYMIYYYLVVQFSILERNIPTPAPPIFVPNGINREGIFSTKNKFCCKYNIKRLYYNQLI
ncbi:MAG: hypothetical protein A2Y87_13010 [Bacteroidetes bacterium RBG_13_46_8]|nr:MAG: hypothetical protein A2Y87_13010 [Bacteroidetes bacterium RBG_13_46_8]